MRQRFKEIGWRKTCRRRTVLFQKYHWIVWRQWITVLHFCLRCFGWWDTNRYAAQKGKHSFQVSPGERKLFMAVLFTSGYAPLPRRRVYWENSPDVNNAAISRAMTRNRFEELLRFIHVANSHNLPQNDRLAKVRARLAKVQCNEYKIFRAFSTYLKFGCWRVNGAVLWQAFC